MSDLENSDDEIDETKKEEIDEIYELENSTKNKISKKKYLNLRLILMMKKMTMVI